MPGGKHIAGTAVGSSRPRVVRSDASSRVLAVITRDGRGGGGVRALVKGSAIHEFLRFVVRDGRVRVRRIRDECLEPCLRWWREVVRLKLGPDLRCEAHIEGEMISVHWP